MMMGSALRYIFPKQKGHTKISACLKKSIHNEFLHHPEVVQLPIENDWPKVSIDVQIVKQLVTNLLFQVYVR